MASLDKVQHAPAACQEVAVIFQQTREPLVQLSYLFLYSSCPKQLAICGLLAIIFDSEQG